MVESNERAAVLSELARRFCEATWLPTPSSAIDHASSILSGAMVDDCI